MRHKYWLILGAAGLCAVQAAACSSQFSSCTDTRTCGAAGSSGMADAADTSAAGDGDGDGDSDPSAGAGASGDGSGEAAIPALFGECTVKGALACEGHASALRFGCDGKLWQAASTCAPGNLCDWQSGECMKVVAECADAKPKDVVCREDTLLTCGTDLVSAVEGKVCAGLCKDGVCQAPTCGDEKVEEGEDCDDPALTKSGECVACKTPVCGDGAVNTPAEQCDDGNLDPGDGCSAKCMAEPVQVVAGEWHTCVLSSTGLVKCWGANLTGELGSGYENDLGGYPGEVPSKLAPVSLGKDKKAVSIAAGDHHSCAVLDDGSVKCWGFNLSGELGTGDDRRRGILPDDMGDNLKPIALGQGRTATQVSIGGQHACALLDNGDVKCWGSNRSGQLGLDSADRYSVPPRQPIPLGGAATAVSASKYSDTTCAVLEDGTAKCWGDSTYLPVAADADLGNPDTAPGGIGDYGDEMEQLKPLNVGKGRTVKAIEAGRFTAALLDDGTVKVWGAEANYGQLGIPGASEAGLTPAALEILEVIDLGTGRKAKMLAAGSASLCAVLDHDALKCWGSNNNGTLGIGSTVDKGVVAGDMGDALDEVYFKDRGTRSVAVGSGHACAILDNGTLRCWGYNGRGQLGLGDFRNRGDTGNKLASDTQVDLSF